MRADELHEGRSELIILSKLLLAYVTCTYRLPKTICVGNSPNCRVYTTEELNFIMAYGLSPNLYSVHKAT
jgi:hypothetical protein